MLLSQEVEVTGVADIVGVVGVIEGAAEVGEDPTDLGSTIRGLTYPIIRKEELDHTLKTKAGKPMKKVEQILAHF